MTSTWEEREAAGTRHEVAVEHRLRAAGWLTARFGQGMMPPATVEALRKTQSPLRWTPDLVAVRGERVLLVDAKTTLKTYDRVRFHVVEAKCVRKQYELFHDQDGLLVVPVVYVFGDFTCAWLGDVNAFGVYRRGSAAGSRTPYYSIDIDLCRAFEEVFG